MELELLHEGVSVEAIQSQNITIAWCEEGGISFYRESEWWSIVRFLHPFSTLSPSDRIQNEGL